MEDEPTTRLLGGRYRLLRPAGRGGMSEVHVARDEVLGRDVAVKLVRAGDVAGDGVGRLEREARATAALSHPNVVVVHDVLRDGDDAAIVMELVRGETLADRLRREGPLDWREAVGLAGRVADGLAAAHAIGIVHRDVKPSNVLLGDDGLVRVADFGIARAVDGSTETATVRGSIPYLAPEQARGEDTDARTDVYALGCVLHEMLVGRPPFADDTGAAIIGQHLHREPTPPGHVVAGIPPELDAVVMRMLAKDPGARHPGMAAVGAELDAVAVAPGAAATAVLPPAPQPTDPVGPNGPVATGGRGNRLVPVLAVLALVAAAGLVWWALAGDPAGDAPAVATTTPPAAPSTEPDPTPSSPTPTPSPSPTINARPETVEEVATAYRAALVDGREQGEASGKAVEELEKLVTEIVRKDGEGKPKDVRDKARELDEKADEMVEEGEMTAALRDRLAPIGQDFLRVAPREDDEDEDD